MVTPLTPRLTRGYGDWYDTMLFDLRDVWRRADSDELLYRSDDSRQGGRRAAEAAITRFVYRLEPSLAELHPRKALREAERLTDRLLHGTHPHDLDYEANQHLGEPEVRTVWPPKAKTVLAELAIDPAMADRYGLDVRQANRVRQRLGIPTVPEPEEVGSCNDPDW